MASTLSAAIPERMVRESPLNRVTLSKFSFFMITSHLLHMLHAVMLFGALCIVETVQGADKVARGVKYGESSGRERPYRRVSPSCLLP